MSIVDDLRRASEALRKRADDLQALSDEVYQAGGEMSDEQTMQAEAVCIQATRDIGRLEEAVEVWWLHMRLRLAWRYGEGWDEQICSVFS